MHNDELYQKFPALFRQTKLKRHESCMYYGIECGNGWIPLIHDMSEELSKIEGIEYAQIKSKFANLRVYLDYADSVSKEDIAKSREILSKYEELSSTMCEVCGKPARLCQSEFGWLSTLCDEHKQEQGAKYATE